MVPEVSIEYMPLRLTKFVKHSFFTILILYTDDKYLAFIRKNYKHILS